MSRTFSAVCAFLCVPLLCPGERKPVTIDTLVSPPKPIPRSAVTPVWAADGKRFAWQEQDKLWLYDVPSGESRELISVDQFKEKAVEPAPPSQYGWENRRVTEEPIQWMPSGKEILVKNRGDLFMLELDSAALTQLTATDVDERDPKLSPDGRHLSFRKDHDLYTMEIASKDVTRLTRDGSDTLLNAELDWLYPEELGLGTAHWWSPDGSWIAYLQFDIAREPIFPQVDLLAAPAKYEPQRYPKAGEPNPDVRLGIVSRDGGPTKWFDLGDTRDAILARVHWSPDSKSIAVQRLNRIQNQLQLHLADIGSGKSRIVLQETDPHWVNLADDFRFLKEGKQFLWSSQRDGFRHLYLYSIDGRPIRQITRGDWEVTAVAEVDEESDRVFYVSTEPSPLERQLYSATLEGKRKRRLTEASGTHTISMSPGAKFYMDSFSSLNMPPRKTLHKTDGSQVAVFQEPDKRLTEELEILPAEIVEVETSDGVTLYGRMIKPANFDPATKYPVVLMIYGGPHSQTVRNAWPCVCWEQVLAQSGFLIWQLDNRGTAFRGLKFETPVFRNLGERELQDQKEGIKYLELTGFADTSRMGIYGWSYGGYMTLYSLMNAPGLFDAGIAGAPVVDWKLYDTIYTERYMGLPEENPEGYKRSAPLHKAAELKAELLLIHNFQDDNVHLQQTMQMADALQRAGKPFEMMIYPQKGHGPAKPVWRHMYETMTRFFERHLKN